VAETPLRPEWRARLGAIGGASDLTWWQFLLLLGAAAWALDALTGSSFAATVTLTAGCLAWFAAVPGVDEVAAR